MPTKLNLRLPDSLADAVRQRADAEGVSVNTLILTLVAGGIGWKPGSVVKGAHK